MIQAAISALPTRTAAPARATSAESSPAPADQVQLSGTPPTANPWPELEKAGVLSASSSIGGSIGSVITQTVRQDLVKALQRLEAGGAKLEYRRRIPLPFGLRGRYEEFSAEKAADFIARKKPDGLNRLEITMPGVARRQVRSLKDLQFADAVLGANVLNATDKRNLECIQSLEKAGFKASNYNNYYYDEAPPPADALEQLRTLDYGRETYFEAPGGGQVSAGKDSLPALDFFRGSGQDRGLKSPDFAQKLKDAEAGGFKFRYDRNEIDSFRAYQIELKDSWVRKGDSVMIPVSKDDLSDLGKLTRAIDEADEVFDEVLAGAFKDAGTAKENAYFPGIVREGAQKFPIKVAAAVYAEMLRGARKGNDDSYRTSERVNTLSKKLYDECNTPFELARKTALVSDTFARHGYEAATKILKQTQEVITSRAASNPQRQEALEDLFFTLLSATGSIGAASEGMDLVRISVGSETQEDRTRLFQALARRLPAGSTDQTAFCYRTVLAERLQTETLAATGERFCKLLEGMAVGRHQDRAAEVFTYFQQSMRDGGGDPKQTDSRVTQFLQNLVIHDDVDKALTSSFGGTTSQGSVQQTEDAIVIGGVRVPRRG